jgi:hypothetical protein
MAITEMESEVLPPLVELTPEEAWAHFDASVRRRLGMSGDEFLRRLDAREFEEIIDDQFNHPWVGYFAQLSLSVR